ncbi:MAG: hypothetical protein M1379_00940 [Firmicutes bacterium]|nr:hypothetical protein [Bacillota bacterium]
MFSFLNVFFFFWGIGALLGLTWVFIRYGIPIFIFVLWEGVVIAKKAFMDGWNQAEAARRQQLADKESK